MAYILKRFVSALTYRYTAPKQEVQTMHPRALSLVSASLLSVAYLGLVPVASADPQAISSDLTMTTTGLTTPVTTAHLSPTRTSVTLKVTGSATPVIPRQARPQTKISARTVAGSGSISHVRSRIRGIAPSSSPPVSSYSQPGSMVVVVGGLAM